MIAFYKNCKMHVLRVTVSLFARPFNVKNLRLLKCSWRDGQNTCHPDKCPKHRVTGGMAGPRVYRPDYTRPDPWPTRRIKATGAKGASRTPQYRPAGRLPPIRPPAWKGCRSPNHTQEETYKQAHNDSERYLNSVCKFWLCAPIEHIGRSLHN